MFHRSIADYISRDILKDRVKPVDTSRMVLMYVNDKNEIVRDPKGKKLISLIIPHIASLAKEYIDAKLQETKKLENEFDGKSIMEDENGKYVFKEVIVKQNEDLLELRTGINSYMSNKELFNQVYLR
jgi:hypothetical protein